MASKIDQLIVQLENYVECWKQFSYFIELSRSKQFTQENERQFLEIKSVLTQELEMLAVSFESGIPPKEEMYEVIGKAPSLRFLSELTEGNIRGLENEWHKQFITWQSVLGQVKAQKVKKQNLSLWHRLFGG